MEPGADTRTAAEMRTTEMQFAEHFRSIVQSDARARLGTAVTSAQPFNERLALFWANHFTVSLAKASPRGLVGALVAHTGEDALLKMGEGPPGSACRR